MPKKSAPKKTAAAAAAPEEVFEEQVVEVAMPEPQAHAQAHAECDVPECDVPECNGEGGAAADAAAAEVVSNYRSTAPKRKRGEKAAKADRADKPKQPPNAFMIYSKEQRAGFDKSVKVTEQAREIGARWRALSEEERTRYKQMAIDLKAAA